MGYISVISMKMDIKVIFYYYPRGVEIIVRLNENLVLYKIYNFNINQCISSVVTIFHEKLFSWHFNTLKYTIWIVI